MKRLCLCYSSAIGLWFGCLTTSCSHPFTFGTLAGMAGNPGTADGTNNAALLIAPTAVAVDAATNVFLTDGSAIRKATLSGTNWVLRTLAGSALVHGDADGTNDGARFDGPAGLSVDGAGSLFVADTHNNTIRRVTPLGTNRVVTTLAGGDRFHPGSTDGTNRAAQFDQPSGIAVDGAGNLYVADTSNHTIRKLAPADTNWVVSTLAGLAGVSGDADGTNSDARFFAPAAITVDATTNLFVADFSNHTIRRLTSVGTNWVVTTVAGAAGVSGSLDGPGDSARFNLPLGLSADAAGNLFVADTGNNTIRRLRAVGASWLVTTVAGTPGATGSANGTGAAAAFSEPDGIAVDSAGALYVADFGNSTLRLGRVAATLQVAQAGRQVLVSWPTAVSNFVLEACGTVAPGAPWNSITSGFTFLGDDFVLSTNSSTPLFFRLRQL